MPTQIPKKLGIPPLIESLVEVRFSSSVNSVSSILPGYLFEAFSTRGAKIVTLPTASILPQIRDIDPNLRYAPIVQITIDPGPYVIQVGDHVAAISCPRPYTGWNQFEKLIREFAKILENTKLITSPERFSMKYIDILSSVNIPTIEPLNIEIRLGGRKLAAEPITLRAETKEGRFNHIFQIIASVNAQLPDGTQLNGVLIENDTIYMHSDGDFWVNFARHLDSMHEVNKRRFFELLKDETIVKLEPEY